MQNMRELVRARMTIKATIDSLSKELKAKIEVEKRRLEVVEGAVLQTLNELGVESVKTEYGTAYKDLKESFTVEDRQIYFDWIREADRFEFLSASISAPNAKQFVEDNKGALPPGVKYSAFLKTKYRKPTVK